MSFFLRKKSFTLFLLIGAVLAGIYSLNNIPKESTPEIVISIVSVSTVYPGASPIDVEESITNILENSLVGGIKNVTKITSSSRDAVSSIILEFSNDVNIQEAITDVENRVNDVKGDLPSGANEPLVQQIKFNDEPIYIFALTSREPLTNLRQQADNIEEEILGVSGVSRVEISGIPERQVTFILDPTKLSQFNVNATDVSRAIQNADLALPPGSIQINDREYRLYLDTGIETIDDIKNSIIAENNGSFVFVRDVLLRVEDGLAKERSVSRVGFSGTLPQQAIIFSVYKQTGGDITALVTEVKERVRSYVDETQSEDSEITSVFDAAYEVQKSLSELVTSGFQTVLVVFLVLWIGLGLREAITASIAIPLSFLITFIGLPLTGSTINFVSLFALIIVIGILIDSAIVVIEGIADELQEGKDHDNAAQGALRIFAKPVIAGTLTTISVFFPLLLLSGITGQFIASIPKAIIVVLVSSLFVALVFIPLLSGWLQKVKIEDVAWLTKKRESVMNRVTIWYEKLLRSILSNRKKKKRIVLVLLALFIGSFVLVGTGLIKSEFFPGEPPETLYLDIELPIQTTIEKTSQDIKPVEAFVSSLDYVTSYTTTIGNTSFFGDGGSGSHVANITIDIEDKKFTDTVAAGIREYVAGVTDKKLTLIFPEGGPPVGSPVQIKFSGDDLAELTRLTIESSDILRSIPGATEVTTSIDEGATEISIRVLPERLAQVGLSAFDVSRIINAAVNGIETTKIRYAGYGDVDVFVKVGLNENAQSHTQTNAITFDVLKNLRVQTPFEGEVLLGSLVKETIRQSASTIRHEEGDRVVFASSNVLDGFVPGQIFSEFEKQIEALNIPEEITIHVGGESDEGAEALSELFVTLLFAIILVIAVLVWQFNSFRNTAIILSVVPLGLIGVLWGIFIFGLTLSFTAMLGFIALVGVVINDSIIIVDVIENKIKAGDSDPIITGSVARLRPVVLTTATTVFGMIPLLFTSPVWVPFAFAVITGLTFASVLTLIVVPMLYNKFGIKAS